MIRQRTFSTLACRSNTRCGRMFCTDLRVDEAKPARALQVRSA